MTLPESFFNRKSEQLLEVSEATAILKAFGIANTDKRTREFVNANELKATPNGSSLKDKRSGYRIQMSHLITFIFDKLPGVKELYEKDKTPKKRLNKTVKDAESTNSNN